MKNKIEQVLRAVSWICNYCKGSIRTTSQIMCDVTNNEHEWVPDYSALASLVQGMVTAERTRVVDLAAFFIPSGEKPDIDLLATLRATLAEQAREIERLKVALHDLVEDVKNDAQG